MKSIARVKALSFLLIIWLIGGLQPVLSQIPNLRFERISNPQILSTVSVNAILQDQEGFLWFGTAEGLNRYDGYTCKTYKHSMTDSNSISGNDVLSLLQDRDGSLWIGTTSGLNKYDYNQEKFTQYLHQSTDTTSISHNVILVLYEDRHGGLWIGTSNGLNYFDREKNGFIRYVHDPADPGSLSNNTIFTIQEDRKGVLWIGTHTGGLNKFDREKNKFVHYNLPSEKKNRIITNEVVSIYEDQGDILWIGTANGLFEFDLNTESFVDPIPQKSKKRKLEGNIIFFTFHSTDQIHWIGTNEGLYRYNAGNDEIYNFRNEKMNHNSLSNNEVKTYFIDRTGIIWFGTSRGINKLNQEKNKFTNYQNFVPESKTLLSNDVLEIFEDSKGMVWVGTTEGGLKLLDRGTGKSMSVPFAGLARNLGKTIVNSIYEGRDGILWIGTMGGGINALDRRTGKNKNYINSNPDRLSLATNIVYTICEDKSNRLWLGTLGGLVQFDRDSGFAKIYRKIADNPNSLSDNRIKTIYKDFQGTLWIGTSDGLNRFNPETITFSRYKNDPANPNSVSNNSINCLYQDKLGFIWIGTTGGGLNRLNPRTNEFIQFQQKDGLASDIICDIFESDDGKLWISTKNGISTFDPEYVSTNFEEYSLPFINYYEADGIQGNVFNSESGFKNKKGEIYFGGNNGFTVFNPAEIFKNQRVPPVVITTFKKFYQDVILDSTITKVHKLDLNYKENILSFEFAALDFSAPEKNQYTYKLDGFNKSWIYLGNQHDVTFTNLDPGNYILRVKGSNNDGIWNEQGVALALHINPPFWQKWWFRLMIGIMTISLLVTGYRIRTRGVIRQNKNLEEMNRILQNQITERQLAEEALRVSEARNRALLNAIPDMMFELEQDGTLLSFKTTQDPGTPFNTEQFRGKKIQEVLPASLWQPAMAAVRNALQKGEIQTFEYQLPYMDSIREYEARIVMSSPQVTLGMVRDITARKRSEKLQQVVYNVAQAVNTVRDVSEFYQIIQVELSKLIDTTNLLIGLYDKETDTISLPFMKDEKDRFEKVPAAHTISSLVIKNNQSLLLKEENMDQLEREGKIGKVGTPCRSWLGVPLHLDKEVIGIIVVQSYENREAFNNADRELLEFVASQLAISIKKKQSEEEIQKLFRSLEQSFSSVILTDHQGLIEYVNPNFTHVTGYAQDEILGKNLRILFPQTTSDTEFRSLWEIVTSGKEWKSEVLNRKKNSMPYWELISISPIKNEQDQISDFLVIKDDITEIKELQLQLTHAQKMESIGTLAGGIAHDFNNLLTVINGHAEICLMKLGEKNPSHRDIVSILQAGKKAEKLTKQLLAFSRKQIYEPKIININQVIHSLDQIFRRLIGEDIQIQINLAETPSKIKADPIQIEQIMINLIVNARDAINFKTEFASEKKITVETGMVYLDSNYVTEHAGSKEGPHVSLSISDNGIGMTEDIKNKIFEPFFTTKESGKGTGLGLATVYGIVKQNQGSIYVYSEPDQGTTFKIYWPVSGETITLEVSETTGQERYRGKETILLVEDEEGVLNFATMALKDQGYTVHQAANGKIALDFMRNNKITIDLLITDLIMPQMSGKELVDRLKKTHPEIRVLFTSGYTDNHIVHSGALKKGLRFIQKPYSVQSLTKKVREILDNLQ